ncbi:MAG TPA: alpha/beta hydrolase [Thermoanaerobaculia bacterium]|nr:alpha/beta hydrolase [Thermoanaerobaculia bacterium]
MPSLPLVLLPGLDGTGTLFEPLTSTAPPGITPIVIRLPELASYDELLREIRLPIGRFAILGESFSGPLALSIARVYPDRVVAVILCNTFVSPPITRLLRFFPWSVLFLLPIPRFIIRWFFVGRAASADLVSAVRSAVAATPRRVLAARMHAVFSLPKPDFRIEVPVLVLSGKRDALVKPNVREFQKIGWRVVHKSVDAPHLLLQAAPVEAWREISAFLEKSS